MSNWWCGGDFPLISFVFLLAEIVEPERSTMRGGDTENLWIKVKMMMTTVKKKRQSTMKTIFFFTSLLCICLCNKEKNGMFEQAIHLFSRDHHHLHKIHHHKFSYKTLPSNHTWIDNHGMRQTHTSWKAILLQRDTHITRYYITLLCSHNKKHIFISSSWFLLLDETLSQSGSVSVIIWLEIKIPDICIVLFVEVISVYLTVSISDKQTKSDWKMELL